MQEPNCEYEIELRRCVFSRCSTRFFCSSLFYIFIFFIYKILSFYFFCSLPYRYNQTVVKILAQTPTTLFVYWDISDVDRINFIEKYGEDFFNKTKPILLIHNL